MLDMNECGTNGTVAAVTKVHYPCDVSCCVAVGQERLQGSFLWMDIRIIIKFHVLLGKSSLECYKSLREGLGTWVASCKTVCRWVNTIKNGPKIQMMPSAVEPQHRRWMNATWSK